MTNQEKLKKFAGGAISGGAVSLLAFLTTQCSIDNWEKFSYAVILAFLSGSFHVTKNMKNS